MLSIPLTLFILIYALFALLTFVFAAINVYHIIVSGTLTLLSFSVAAITVLLMVGVLVTTGIYLSSADLSQNLVLLGTTTIPGL